MDRKSVKRKFERAGQKEANEKLQRMELLGIIAQTTHESRSSESDHSSSEDEQSDGTRSTEEAEGEVASLAGSHLEDAFVEEAAADRPSDGNISLSESDENSRTSSSSESSSSGSSVAEFDAEVVDIHRADQPPVIEDRDKYVVEQLAQWAAFNVSKKKVDELLRRLKPIHNSLPLSYKTLLETPVSIPVKDCGTGQLWYCGIMPHLSRLLSVRYLQNHQNIIAIDVNIDSVPLHKSKNMSFTPILGRLVNQRKPFVIAVFCGVGEPHNLDDFLQDFVDEVQKLLLDGFEYNDTKYQFRIRNYIFDQKARAMFKRVKGVRGYYCCEKCVVRGTDHMNRMCLLEHDCELRTDESFLELASKIMMPRKEHFDDEDEQDEHAIGTSPLLAYEKKMISKFRLDSMHLVYKGVFLRWLNFICKGRGNYSLSNQTISEISAVSVSLKKYIPIDFNRKPQSLANVSSFKATELRRLLLYDGLVVFSRFLDNNIYKNFLLLHCSIYILCSPRYHLTLNEEAGTFLRLFVNHCTDVFGLEFIVYNVHSLVHLAQECKDNGPLDTFGAFPYEDLLKSIKETLKSGYRPLQQIARREIEKSKFTVPEQEEDKEQITLKMPKLIDPNEVTPGQQYKKLCFHKISFIIIEADCCCMLKNGSVCVLENFVESNNGPVIVGRKFLSSSDFYDYPLPSHLLGIVKVSNLSAQKECWKPTDIDQKCVLLPIHANDAEYKFAVVEFKEKESPLPTSAVIPTSWLDEDAAGKLIAWWYPKDWSEARAKRAVTQCEPPNKNTFRICEDVRVLHSYNTYLVAHNNWKKSDDTSNLDTDNDQYLERGSRKRRPFRRGIISSDEETQEKDKNNKRSKHPAAPAISKAVISKADSKLQNDKTKKKSQPLKTLTHPSEPQPGPSHSQTDAGKKINTAHNNQSEKLKSSVGNGNLNKCKKAPTNLNKSKSHNADKEIYESGHSKNLMQTVQESPAKSNSPWKVSQLLSNECDKSSELVDCTLSPSAHSSPVKEFQMRSSLDRSTSSLKGSPSVEQRESPHSTSRSERRDSTKGASSVMKNLFETFSPSEKRNPKIFSSGKRNVASHSSLGKVSVLSPKQSQQSKKNDFVKYQRLKENEELHASHSASGSSAKEKHVKSNSCQIMNEEFSSSNSSSDEMYFVSHMDSKKLKDDQHQVSPSRSESEHQAILISSGTSYRSSPSYSDKNGKHLHSQSQQENKKQKHHSSHSGHKAKLSVKSQQEVKKSKHRSLPSSSGENASVLNLLCTVNQKLDTVMKQNTTILRAVRPPQKIIEPANMPPLPVDNAQNFEELEDYLRNSENKATTSEFLSRFVNRDVKLAEQVFSLMRSVMSDKLACYFNWKGSKGKRGFEKSNLAATVNCALLCLNKECNLVAAAEHMKGWLKYAPKRSKGVSKGCDFSDNEYKGGDSE